MTNGVKKRPKSRIILYLCIEKKMFGQIIMPALFSSRLLNLL